jgi:hypothetical protein
MRTIECSSCHQSLATNQTVLIGERALCEPCAVADLKALGNSEPDPTQLRKQVDPTICFGCHKDNGSTVWPTLQSGLPVCEECRDAFLNRPYPNWIRLSFAGLVVVAVISFWANWRFVVGFRSLKQATRAMQSGQIHRARTLITGASASVPESADLKKAALLYTGIDKLTLQDSAGAIAAFRELEVLDPTRQDLPELMDEALLGETFNRHDYDAFLAVSQRLFDRRPSDPARLAGLASAYACKFASTGDNSLKAHSLQLLDQSKRLAGAKAPPELGALINRTYYRLETRQILSPAEFTKRFPDGWKGTLQ